MNSIRKFLFDMVTDIRNAYDEKRVWGNVLMIVGVAFPFFNPSSYVAAAVSGGFLAVGTALLFKSASLDPQIGTIRIPEELTKIITSVKSTSSSSSIEKDGE